MSVKTCSAGGTQFDGGIELNGSDNPVFGGVTVVADGTFAPLGDGVDDTYIQNTGSGQMDYMVRFNALTSFESGDPIFLHLRWSMNTDIQDGTYSETFLFLQWMDPTNTNGDNVVGQFANTWNVPYALSGTPDGTIRETVLPFVCRPPGTGGGTGVDGATLDEVLAVLTTGECYLDVNTFAAGDGSWTSQVGRIIEAYLLVGEAATVIPARRLYPRQDGLGIGIGRIWPAPNTPQSGRGIGPGAPF